MRRRTPVIVAITLVSAIGLIAPSHAKPGGQGSTQTCPLPGGGDADRVQIDTSTLWPPNHQLVPVTLTAKESVGEATSGKAVTIHAELRGGHAVDKGGDPDDTGPDYIAGPDGTGPNGSASTVARIRAERSGATGGRQYVIDWTASFDSGGPIRSCSSIFGPTNPIPKDPFVVTVPVDGNKATP
jgi:hypothetical protein